MPTFRLTGTSPETPEISSLNVADGYAAATMFEAALSGAAEEGVKFEDISPRTVQSPYYIEQVDGAGAGRKGPLVDGRWCVGRHAKVAGLAPGGGYLVTGGEEDGPTVALGIFPNIALSTWFMTAWRVGLVKPMKDAEVTAAYELLKEIEHQAAPSAAAA